MAKDKSDKRDKKEKKEKRSEADGVKTSKKEKKPKLKSENIAAALEEVSKETEEPVVETVAETKTLVAKESSAEVVVKPVGALVPFANPLADEKATKKVLKSVKKGTSSSPQLNLLYFAIKGN